MPHPWEVSAACIWTSGESECEWLMSVGKQDSLPTHSLLFTFYSHIMYTFHILMLISTTHLHLMQHFHLYLQPSHKTTSSSYHPPHPYKTHFFITHLPYQPIHLKPSLLSSWYPLNSFSTHQFKQLSTSSSLPYPDILCTAEFLWEYWMANILPSPMVKFWRVQ